MYDFIILCIILKLLGGSGGRSPLVGPGGPLGWGVRGAGAPWCRVDHLS